MDKTMIRLFFISVIFSFSSKAQTWQTIPLSLYNPTQIQYLHWDKGDPTTSFKQHFKINKFDNSLWGMHDSKVMRLDNNGIFQLWDESTTNLFQLGDTYADINFSSTHTFLVSQFTRLFKFDGAAWSILSNADKGLNLAMDSDTLWVSKFNENYLKITNATNINFGSMSYPRRMASKNGFTFFSSSLYLGGLSKLTEPTFTFYNPTVNTYYLDYENYDFKFSTVSDTLFTSGNRGFSLAINGVFVDTITKYNTTNMPDLAITEFEFDSQGNIWAVFAPPSTNGVFNNERIGYLDRSTNTWSQFYDETNSPIDFPRVSIEIDTNDNLWVANILNLHVLNSGNLPQWLSTIDLTKTKPFVHVYPNPSKGKIQIEASFEITHFTVHDLLGKEIMKGKNVSEINLPKGVYIISLFGTNGEQAKEKVLIE
jgi:hypothetical protein|tara:strand:- start:340 stop:1614 length:1275 start_codon:yes stop_codon:yes gene_type:complete